MSVGLTYKIRFSVFKQISTNSLRPLAPPSTKFPNISFLSFFLKFLKENCKNLKSIIRFEVGYFFFFRKIGDGRARSYSLGEVSLFLFIIMVLNEKQDKINNWLFSHTISQWSRIKITCEQSLASVFSIMW